VVALQEQRILRFGEAVKGLQSLFRSRKLAPAT